MNHFEQLGHNITHLLRVADARFFLHEELPDLASSFCYVSAVRGTYSQAEERDIVPAFMYDFSNASPAELERFAHRWITPPVPECAVRLVAAERDGKKIVALHADARALHNLCVQFELFAYQSVLMSGLPIEQIWMHPVLEEASKSRLYRNAHYSSSEGA